jgi:dipeptide/tripeptide permease
VWLWRLARPLVFGFLPVGLFYHAVFSVAAAGLMGLLVFFAWPGHLEASAERKKDEP